MSDGLTEAEAEAMLERMQPDTPHAAADRYRRALRPAWRGRACRCACSVSWTTRDR